ncbi:TetR/AcrR family transcriptional regulator [Planosporangium thailandense]|uniref:TetR/AcrR family transcriptional regulator n=1 Tax=Planosporangium thailandense TaxID=765197 RepID=A0ABX0XTT6_9ACTN|nr:TetR/AcrR family transcriptional regulator C-terminal domain-containing protein [Planosporangium thailandense]NJC69403.1 TetR/AcrR family transcriptional regulator [Planosporangium thailandense]
MTQRRTRAPRHTLDRSAIAAAALDLMDAEGARALTIRSLAARLGVAPMALYNHVHTKEEILDAALEHGLARLPGADPGRAAGGWVDRIRSINLAFHRALREHPSLVTLLVARPLGGQAPIGAAEAQLRVLVEAGFAPDEAARAHLTLLHYAIGSAAWTSPRVEPPAVGRAVLERLPAERYPTLAALAAPLATASYDDDQYAYGLDLLLAGVQRIPTVERPD